LMQPSLGIRLSLFLGTKPPGRESLCGLSGIRYTWHQKPTRNWHTVATAGYMDKSDSASESASTSSSAGQSRKRPELVIVVPRLPAAKRGKSEARGLSAWPIRRAWPLGSKPWTPPMVRRRRAWPWYEWMAKQLRPLAGAKAVWRLWKGPPGLVA
jgi:hypothetical protein